MKIYTRTGDGGETRLFGGSRVSKDDARIEAGGAIDELNSAIGLARTSCQDTELQGHLSRLQEHLFTVGAELSTLPGSPAEASRPEVDPVWIDALERAIDTWESELPPLKLFVLPGGGRLGAELHLARTICRRAERRIVTLASTSEVDPRVIAFVNRLSDFLFVAARIANHREQVKEPIWDPRQTGPSSKGGTPTDL